jgi:hypothetical protein
VTAPASKSTPRHGRGAAPAASCDLTLPPAGAWSIAVRAAPDALGWLEEFLCPPFGARRAPLAAEAVDVELSVDAARFATLDAGSAWHEAPVRPVFALDAGAVELPTRETPDGGWVVRDAAFRAIYELSPGASFVEIVAAAPDLRLRTPLLRVVRERVMGALFAAGWPLLHASAVERGGRAVAFLGATAAGKTSLLLHALGLAGARLLANDRLCVRRDGERVVAFPVPTIVTLRESGLAFFPHLAARLAASRFTHRLSLAETRDAEAPAPRPWSNGKYGLTPAQLAALLGVERAASAELAAVVLPRHSGERGGVALRRLAPGEAEAELRGAQLGHGAWMRATALFRPPRVSEAAAIAARDAELERLAEVPVYAAELGLDAYADADAHARLAALLEART